MNKEMTMIAEGRASARHTVWNRSFRQFPARQNFVRPAKQVIDPSFPCPCCSQKLSISASQVGQNARCRHCYSPIRTADPSAGRPAIDLSHELGPITRPQDYPLCGHRASLTDYIPRGAVAAMPLLALVALATTLIVLLPKGSAAQGAIAGAYGPTPIEVLTSPAREAEEVIVKFLSSPDWTHSVSLVHGGLEFSGEISALAEHLPKGGFRTTSRLNEDGTSTVRVHFKDGSLTHFQVANIGGEDLILWNANHFGMPDESSSRMAGVPELEPK